MTTGALLDAVRPFIARGVVPGAVVGLLREDRVWLDAVGTIGPGDATPLTPDTPMRISSNTKPLAAALTLALAEDGVLAVDDPVDRFVPELADRRVLRRLDGPLDDTVPAERAVTIEDLLTMRLGFGFVFEAECRAVDAAARAGLGIGPPDPSLPLDPDGWVERFAALPLLEQPGTRWRYDLAYAVLGVLLARAGGRPLDELMRVRLLEPWGLDDTAFHVPAGRLPPCFAAGEAGLTLYDGTTDSRWTRPPAFPDARNGLVSTAADLVRFAGALLAGGRGVLSPDSVTAMTTDRLTAEQRTAPSAQAFLDGLGWGYGLQVSPPGTASPTRYGWGGGLGTLCYTWPEHHAAAVLLTQVLPPAPELITAFLAAAEDTTTR